MKRRLGGILCAALVLSALPAFCGSCGKREADGIQKPDGPKPDGAEEIVTDSLSLRERFPEYIDLSAFKGLEVYVWSLAEGSYRCGILPGTNRNKTQKEIWDMGFHGVSVADMKEILAAYDVPDDEVFLFACAQPISSYLYPIDEDYCRAVSAQFDDRFACFAATDFWE